MPARLTHEQATAVVLPAGYEPLEPYPGAKKRWRCRHVPCGQVVGALLDKIKQGTGACPPCGVAASAAGRRVDAEEAREVMLARLLEPLDEYPGTNHPWRSRHLLCGREIRPRLMHIRQGRVGCLECGFASNKTKQLGDPVQAAADMREAGHEPLEVYPGAAHPWRCVHQPCGRTVRPRLHHIRSGQGGCSNCAAHGFNTAAPAVLYVLHHPVLVAVKAGITWSESDRIERFEKRGWLRIRVWPYAIGREAKAVERAVHKHLRDKLGLGPHLDPSAMGAVGGWTETYDAELVPVLELVRLVEAEVAT
ncbi:hypothetical protein M8Z33_07350 [Streptomyces sp. ZAF1911]|uniref:hypothetical protein n=1 Tax=Streptomyces sp. ZAF1911 TaxID=2944129 RepID=UPI00237B07DF|nr:hypothetical protein [Streptomyces sp. ZAF1911]MDD9376489.1 hypothetical protein [Streptomyces sp. ZAF1911]